MADVLSSNPLPRSLIVGAGVLLAAVLLTVASIRLSGTPIRSDDADTLVSRSLRFADRPDSGVDIIDARSGQVIEVVQGEAGFLRGTLRALARERKMRDLGAGPAFELVGRSDGRLTLLDPATGQRIDLESFGPTNAAVFGRLLTLNPPPQAGTAPIAARP